MNQNYRDLTKAEEEVMHHLWTLKQAFVKEIVAEFPDPKPAYNTISTIVRILENKGVVGHDTFGKSHRYYPVISKDEYAEAQASKLMGNYFGNSLEKMLSFFVEREKLSTDDVNELLKDIQESKKKKDE